MVATVHHLCSLRVGVVPRVRQVHVDRHTDTVAAFSRSGENCSFKFTDVLREFRRGGSALGPDVHSIILEGEAVAVDRITGRILPFAAVTTRMRYAVN